MDSAAKPARQFSDVVDQVTAAIPRDPDTDHLVAELYRLRLNSSYQPPESHMPWEMLRELLSANIGAPTAPWQQRVSDVVMGRVPA